ncbi:barrier-to-autointegration factor-like [Brevipalpus obovatus]|uniref:barrier-to-autointegration factor-like n=1 Tax=Brevipalpus obovatus TaxID=246614 RepID=UPI003D9E746D
MTTSKKHAAFTNEPMRDKDVSTLPGVGPALGPRLIEKGYNKAYHVLGMYLCLDNEEKFKQWFRETAQTNNAKYANDCYNCLREWCDKYIN